MSRMLSRWFTLLTAVLVWGQLGIGLSGSAPPPSAKILPATTRQHLSIPSLASLMEGWNKTDFAKLFEELQPLVDQANRQGIDGLGLGIAWNALQAAASGEISLAFTYAAPSTANHLITIDTTGKKNEAAQLIAAIKARLQMNNFSVQSKKVAGADVEIFTGLAGEKRVLAVKDQLLIGGDGVAAVEDLLQRWETGAKDSLENVKAYADVKRRTESKSTAKPHLYVYVDPFGVADGQKFLSQRPAKGRDMVKIIKNEGFDAFQGFGAAATFGSADHQTFFHVSSYAPPPYQKSMRMLRFLPGKDFTPPAWASNQLSVFGAVNMDIKNAFDSFGSLFDAVISSGDQGTFDDVIKDLRDDPNGPQLDFPKEVIGRLGKRVLILNDVDPALGAYSERMLVAVETSDEGKLEKAIRRMMENDEEVKRRDIKGREVWEIPPPKKKKKAGSDPEVKAPSSAVTVAHGHLMVATNIALLEKVLSAPTNPLAGEADYQRIAKELTRLAPADSVLQWFSRPDREFQVVYEALRKNQLVSSRSVYSQVLNSLLSSIDKNQVDSQKLPPFERLRPYLGPTGMFMSNAENGWDLTGFSFRKSDGKTAK